MGTEEGTASDDDGFVVAEPFQLTNRWWPWRRGKRDERREGEEEEKTRENKRILERKGVVGKERVFVTEECFGNERRVELLGCRVGLCSVSSVLTTTRAVQDIFF